MEYEAWFCSGMMHRCGVGDNLPQAPAGVCGRVIADLGIRPSGTQLEVCVRNAPGARVRGAPGGP